MTISTATTPIDFPHIKSAITTGLFQRRLASASTYGDLSTLFFRDMLAITQQFIIIQEPFMIEPAIEEEQLQVVEYTEPHSDEDHLWLKVAESSFDFWDNESDAIFDTL